MLTLESTDTAALSNNATNQNSNTDIGLKVTGKELDDGLEL